MNSLIVIDFGIAKRGIDKLKTKSGTVKLFIIIKIGLLCSTRSIGWII